MTNIDWFFVVFSAIIAYQVTRDIFGPSPFVSSQNLNKKSEAREFFENMSDARVRQTELPIGIAKMGLALAKKKKDDKFDLIPQVKIDPKQI